MGQHEKMQRGQKGVRGGRHQQSWMDAANFIKKLVEGWPKLKIGWDNQKITPRLCEKMHAVPSGKISMGTGMQSVLSHFDGSKPLVCTLFLIFLCHDAGPKQLPHGLSLSLKHPGSQAFSWEWCVTHLCPCARHNHCYNCHCLWQVSRWIICGIHPIFRRRGNWPHIF